MNGAAPFAIGIGGTNNREWEIGGMVGSEQNLFTTLATYHFEKG